MDAREALPPLLHPRMLADVEGYDAWERSVIDTLARAQAADTALDQIELATEDVRRWTPGQGSLAGAVRAAFVTPLRPVTTARHTRELGIVRAMYRGDVSLGLPGDHAAAWHALTTGSPTRPPPRDRQLPGRAYVRQLDRVRGSRAAYRRRVAARLS